MLSEMTIKDFITELASHSPAPGGGSVAALTGSMGAALLSMVSQLTLGKKGYEAVQEEVRGLGEQAAAIARELTHLMDVDTEVFNQLMAAFKLPKETEAEKAGRSAAIQKAYQAAADVPLQVAGKCLDVLHLCPALGEKGNKNAASDVGVAAYCAWSGLKEALLNVQINIGSIKDSNYVEAARAKMEALSSEGKVIYERVVQEIESSL